jgi:hypothetical protein
MCEYRVPMQLNCVIRAMHVKVRRHHDRFITVHSVNTVNTTTTVTTGDDCDIP